MAKLTFKTRIVYLVILITYGVCAQRSALAKPIPDLTAQRNSINFARSILAKSSTFNDLSRRSAPYLPTKLRSFVNSRLAKTAKVPVLTSQGERKFTLRADRSFVAFEIISLRERQYRINQHFIEIDPRETPEVTFSKIKEALPQLHTSVSLPELLFGSSLAQALDFPETADRVHDYAQRTSEQLALTIMTFDGMAANTYTCYDVYAALDQCKDSLKTIGTVLGGETKLPASESGPKTIQNQVKAGTQLSAEDDKQYTDQIASIHAFLDSPKFKDLNSCVDQSTKLKTCLDQLESESGRVLARPPKPTDTTAPAEISR